MAPSFTIDTTSDFEMPSTTTTQPTQQQQQPQRTLLLAAHDRNATDIQMLDRLDLGLVSLPAATYDTILLLTDVDGARSQNLSRAVVERLAASLKPEGRLSAQSGGLQSGEITEGVLAGLVADAQGGGLVKPQAAAAQTVKLSFGRKNKAKADAAAVPANAVEAINTAKRKSVDISTNGNGNGSFASSGPVKMTPAGVGFVELGDEFGMDYDEDEDMEIPSNEELERAERIDPDSLLTEEDRMKPLNIRTSLRSFHYSIQPNPLTLPQPKPANPTPSAAARAKTAAVVSPSGSTLKTRRNGPTPTPTWPSCNPKTWPR
jgi:hypothetical protein